MINNKRITRPSSKRAFKLDPRQLKFNLTNKNDAQDKELSY
jgi:hypothetical protein